ncbi:hypothetical protein H0A36_17395 [Endozoicomonas sp. SM1973]|uniref:Uncharacterized protein n=1 Tax=Spartinivicinus marinus TaxID=2994442 RepID=A0A853ICY7_9GAMM|nr:hypothetical protein [Spartinivicinus marinus]MCX4030148.1 hypothetical protein [Spartinivicinus marinus]NYZ67791.1 hypothetical protein [Spartinivicinus marinus]
MFELIDQSLFITLFAAILAAKLVSYVASQLYYKRFGLGRVQLSAQAKSIGAVLKPKNQSEYKLMYQPSDSQLV